MSIWREYFTTHVPVKPYLRRDAYGAPSYGPQRIVKCRMEFRRANVIGTSGETVVSEIKLFAADEITAGSLVTIQGIEWPVISCAPMMGLDGVTDYYEMRA